MARGSGFDGFKSAFAVGRAGMPSGSAADAGRVDQAFVAHFSKHMAHHISADAAALLLDLGNGERLLAAQHCETHLLGLGAMRVAHDVHPRLELPIAA